VVRSDPGNSNPPLFTENSFVLYNTISCIRLPGRGEIVGKNLYQEANKLKMPSRIMTVLIVAGAALSATSAGAWWSDDDDYYYDRPWHGGRWYGGYPGYGWGGYRGYGWGGYPGYGWGGYPGYGGPVVRIYTAPIAPESTSEEIVH
jgi:hypothetical protein